MTTLDKLNKHLIRGELKEAAEWIKESPCVAFGNADELRALLHMIADAILDGKKRPGKFSGQRLLAHRVHDDETGAEFPLIRKVSQDEWERQIYLAVKANTDAAG